MKLTLIIKTRPGIISVVFIIISLIFVIVTAIIGTKVEPTNNGGFFDYMPLALMALGAFVAAVISFIVGLTAVVKHKERSILFIICLAISVLFIYFGIAQFIGQITGTH